MKRNQNREPLPVSRPSHEFRIETVWLRMNDGVKLSATMFKPIARAEGEKFPVLLELLPYRKDDSFYLRDYPLYSYFAQRGYICVKVDVRGTGSSQGRVPEREYSERELRDAVEIISQLAELPDANGNVGMWGISWGGFNAIQVAMQRPPALKAILALHTSDDLFHDDVRFIDGIMHVDPYSLGIDHENGLPASPHYRVDKAYFRDRFNAYPWLLTYLKQQRDSVFWRDHSLRWNYNAINIPCYLISGLLDGYRDSIPRMLEHMKVPMVGEIGPWNHTFPDIGTPGPRHEWRERALFFWDQWLKGKPNRLMKKQRLAVFVREGHSPDPQQKTTPGHWRLEDWPIKRTKHTTFRATAGGALVKTSKRDRLRKREQSLELNYVASAGIGAGYWWGEPTGDMRRDDALSLVFDSAPLTQQVEIVGFPKVRIKVSTDAPAANFIARLEDVHPDGSVSLVTGAGLNAAHREDRVEPTAMVKGTKTVLEFELHFTTWTFKPGHRIRLALSNAQFPMFWPSANPVTSTFQVGSNEATTLTIPVIPFEARPEPDLPAPQPREPRPDAKLVPHHITTHGVEPNWRPKKQTRDVVTDETAVSSGTSSAVQFADRLMEWSETTSYTTSDKDPARSSFTGTACTTISRKRRKLELITRIKVASDAQYFHVTFTRKLCRNGKVLRRRTWKERIPRDFQ